MKPLSHFSLVCLSSLLFSFALPTVAQSNIDLVQKMQQNSATGYAQLHVTHRPAVKPKATPAPAEHYVADINLQKPDRFDLILSGDKNATLTIGAADGKVIWKDGATGLSGSAAYDEVVDVAVRVLLGKTANLKQEFKFSEFTVGKSKASAVELNAVVLTPRQFGTQLQSITVWLNAGNIIGIQALYLDGASTFASITKLKLEP
jgi:hypothetical protein